MAILGDKGVMQPWLLGAELLFTWAEIDLNLLTWNCTHSHWGAPGVGAARGTLTSGTSGTSGTWAGPSQQQSRVEKKTILLLDLSHYRFTFLSMEEQIGLTSGAQLRKMQQGGKT